MFPEVLSPLQHEFRSWHDNLSHLHPKSMLRLEKLGVLPPIFLDLKYDVPLCESCIFITSKSMQWIKKGNKSWSKSKYTENKPGSRVLVDQLK